MSEFKTDVKIEGFEDIRWRAQRVDDLLKEVEKLASEINEVKIKISMGDNLDNKTV